MSYAGLEQFLGKATYLIEIRREKGLDGQTLRIRGRLYNLEGAHLDQACEYTATDHDIPIHALERYYSKAAAHIVDLDTNQVIIEMLKKPPVSGYQRCVMIPWRRFHAMKESIETLQRRAKGWKRMSKRLFKDVSMWRKLYKGDEDG